MSETGVGYEGEQETLRQKQEGVQDLSITAPQVPKVNPEVYRDLESLLFKGFVYAPSDINGVSVIFKSLNHHEYERLGFLDLGGRTRSAIRGNYSRFLAHCVLMVDGINILPDRNEWITEVTEMFDHLMDRVREKIVFQISEINRRANIAAMLVEVFAMESTSRLRWAQVQGLDLTSTAVTGFAGTETLGLNYGQLMWRAINHIQDRKETEESDWDNAKFVASATAGKGMAKVNAQDKRRKEEERDSRLERRDKILRLALFGEDPESDQQDKSNMAVARTVEELASQLEHDLKGEKDWHDQVVEAHEKRVREGYLLRAQQIEKMRDDFRSKHGDMPVMGETRINQGLTPKEVDDRIRKRREGAAERLSRAQKHAAFSDPARSEFLEKWVQTDRDPSQAMPVVPPRPPGKPFSRGDA